MGFDSSNCGSPGNFISEGEECDITCPDGKSLVSDVPTCINGITQQIEYNVLQRSVLWEQLCRKMLH